MALQPRRIFIDVQSRQFVSAPTSNLPSASPSWVDEDVELVEIYALRPTTDPSNPYAFVDLSSATVKFAVGSTTPAALQTVWSATSTSVTVTPTEIVNGIVNGSVDEVQRLTWTGAIPVSGSYALRFLERTLTCTVSGKFINAANHGIYDGQIVKVVAVSGTSLPTGVQDFVIINAGQNSFQIANIGTTTALLTDLSTGTVEVTVGSLITPSIRYNASAAAVQQAIVEAGFAINGIPQILVSGENGKQLDLYFGGRNGGRPYPTVLIANNTLTGAPGISANVSYNTSEIAALIAAGTTNVTMEVEISEGAVRQTFRQPATLSSDLISSTSPSPLPANVATSFDLQSQDGSVFTISVTNSGELMIAEIP